MTSEQQDMQGHGEDASVRVWEARAYLIVRAQTREEAIDILSLVESAADKLEAIVSLDESPLVDVSEDYE